jgi:hypothetical protein
MTDMQDVNGAEETAPVPTTRIFKIGSARIVEDESLRGLSIDDAKARLKAAYPEIANATHREKTEGEHTLVEFLPQPGRKG